MIVGLTMYLILSLVLPQKLGKSLMRESVACLIISCFYSIGFLSYNLLTNLLFVTPSGATASHSFVLESKVKGVFHGAPAVIKFRIPTKAALQVYLFTLSLFVNRKQISNVTV